MHIYRGANWIVYLYGLGENNGFIYIINRESKKEDAYRQLYVTGWHICVWSVFPNFDP
jgi:hypothetical protein